MNTREDWRGALVSFFTTLGVLLALVVALVLLAGSGDPAAIATQPSTLTERGIEMKPGYRVELHRLPNGVPCAVLSGGPDQTAITCGWDAKPVRK